MIKKLSTNILIYGLTNGLRSLVPFLMLPILTVYLSVEDYGILSLIEVSILFIAPIISLNINSAINVEYFTLEHNELKKYITNALLLSLSVGLFLSLVGVLFKNPISNSLGLESFLVELLPVFAFLRVISSVVLGLYQVSGQPIKFAFYTFIQTIIDFSLSYYLVAILQVGYIGRLEGLYIAFFIASIYGLFILYKMNYLASIFTWKYTMEILRYGVPLIPHVLGGIVLAMSDRFFISYFIGNDSVGYYSVAYQMAALMLLVSVSINQAWMPMLFKLLVDFKKNEKLIYRYTVYFIILYTICALVIYMLSDFIFAIFVDEKFYKAKEYFPFLLIGFLFQSYYYLFTNILFFLKKTAVLAKLTFYSALINIFLNYIFIIHYGTIGVAYATAITYALYLLIVMYVSINSLKKVTIP